MPLSCPPNITLPVPTRQRKRQKKKKKNCQRGSCQNAGVLQTHPSFMPLSLGFSSREQNCKIQTHDWTKTSLTKFNKANSGITPHPHNSPLSLSPGLVPLSVGKLSPPISRRFAVTRSRHRCRPRRRRRRRRRSRARRRRRFTVRGSGSSERTILLHNTLLFIHKNLPAPALHAAKSSISPKHQTE